MTQTTEKNNKIFTTKNKIQLVEMTKEEVKEFYNKQISEVRDIFDGIMFDVKEGNLTIPRLKAKCERILERYKEEFDYDGTCIIDNVEKYVADAQNKLEKYLSVGHYIEEICEICKRIIYRFVCDIK